MKKRVPVIAAASFALALLAPEGAHAEVRTGDLILGTSAIERGIDASELPDISAPHAIVVGPDGRVYYERNASDPIKIASTTKVMTTLVALEHCELSDIVTVDHAAATVGESCVGLLEGDTLTMEEALTGLMVMSGNDAATAIATTAGAKIDPSSDDPYGVFIDAMNAKAAELGCTDTVFENPHGLDFDAWVGDMHSTASDMAKIYNAAMENDEFRAINTTDRTSIEVTSADGSARTIDLAVRNEIRGKSGNIGGKTGTTYEAGNCFIGTYVQDAGGEVTIAVFGCEDNEARWADSLALSSWYYGHISTVPMANSPRERGGAPVIAEAPCTSWTDRTADVTLSDPDATMHVFNLGEELEQKVSLDELSGAVEKGQKVGTISYLQDGEVVSEADLVAAENVPAPSPLEWAMVQFDRLIRFFTGEPGVAETRVLNKCVI
ncbi:MAG: D-alanyl-D-alanine carboxypeptidase [Coriobacteriaceae bacterium]|nr:D-alanyl-D-alanine carboxypeptidase [Coriobacteriaceae bacterium]